MFYVVENRVKSDKNFDVEIEKTKKRLKQKMWIFEFEEFFQDDEIYNKISRE